MDTIATLCEKASKNENEFVVLNTGKSNEWGRRIDLLVKRIAQIKETQSFISADERFNRILNHIIFFIRNEEESIVFEENCRQLVGVRGYILYTVDKIISSCFKHIHSSFAESINNEIVVYFLFHYFDC